jgi:phosphoglucomutase
VAASAEQRALLAKLTPGEVGVKELAGEPIVASFTEAPGNRMPIGGLKVATRDGWFAARPSGTESIYKIYTESFRGREHLARIQEEAKAIIAEVFRKAGV